MQSFIFWFLAILLLSCSAQKATLKTLSNFDLATHHPISLACLEIAKDLDKQLHLLKDEIFAVEAFRKASSKDRSDDLLGSILAEEIAVHLTRLGYNVSVTSAGWQGKGSFDPERINFYISGTYFASPNRLSIITGVSDVKSDVRVAASSVSVLKTKEVDNLIKMSNKKSLFNFERVPLIDKTFF